MCIKPWRLVKSARHECRLELHCCACLIVVYCACWRAQPGSDSTVCRHLDEAKHVGLADAHWHVPNKTTRPLVCVTVKSFPPWTSSIVSIRADWSVPAFMVTDLTGTNELLETTTQTSACVEKHFFLGTSIHANLLIRTLCSMYTIQLLNRPERLVNFRCLRWQMHEWFL